METPPCTSLSNITQSSSHVMKRYSQKLEKTNQVCLQYSAGGGGYNDRWLLHSPACDCLQQEGLGGGFAQPESGKTKPRMWTLCQH